MSNEEILNTRWEKTDKTLKDYMKKFQRLEGETLDKLLDMFDSLDITYQDLNKPISKREKRKLDRKIEEWQEQGILTGYFKFLVMSKRKLKYSDLLEILIYGIYVEQEQKMKEHSKNAIRIVADDCFYQGIDDLPQEIEKPKKTPLEWEFIWSLLWIPSYNKSWNEYLDLLAMTHQQEMYKKFIAILQRKEKINELTIKPLLRKQTNKMILINDGKFSGALDDMCRLVGNKAYLKPAEELDIECRFIAEMDSRTTKMCHGMNNMKFKVNGTNKFYRYSAIDDRDVLYVVKGLVQGINLPPIENHFHWCRSTITYQLEEKK